MNSKSLSLNGSKMRRIPARSTPYALGISRSGIQGRGVYALEDLPAGKRIIEYTGRKLSRMQAAGIKYPSDRYLADNKRGYIVDPRVGGNGSHLINHSCVPNLRFVIRQGRIFLRTLRKIYAGEELTVGYNYRRKMRRVECRCGAKNCRGTLRLILE